MAIIASRVILKHFYQFLCYSIDKRRPVPESIEQMDWEQLFAFCEKQALLGIGYKGIERLSSEGIRLPKMVVFTWYAAYEQIAARNKELNAEAVEVWQEYEEDGFECCLLKGQGNAAMYPDPLSRTPGDVDIYVRLKTENGKGGIGSKRKAISEYVRERHEITGIRYHHIEYELGIANPQQPIAVEVHFTPSTMNNPLFNHRLHKWFQKEWKTTKISLPLAPSEERGSQQMVNVPTVETNVVYQLAHMMHHFFDEGIGLRQVMDYYFLLVNSEKGKVNSYDYLLRHLGLRKFAGAVMWIEHEVFGLEEQYFIVPADEWRGRTLLDEILQGGNFGQHSGLTQHRMGVKYFLKIRRNLGFVIQYPSEALFEPFFRTWHFFWRITQR